MTKFYCSILDVLYACGPYHLIYTEPLLAVCFFYITLLSFVSNSVNHILLCCFCSVVKSLLCQFVTAVLIFFPAIVMNLVNYLNVPSCCSY